MCGIAAIVSSAASVTPSAIAAMTERMVARGPDDEGFAFIAADGSHALYGGRDTPASVFQGTSAYAPRERFQGEVPLQAVVALGHRRLTIIDLSERGHQPMSYGDGRYWITYNGEIYNYLEIREELEALGHRFHSRSDTEVVLASYAQWGSACQSRFVGMWGFVIYDAQARTIFASRDFFGIKPLYYAPLPDGMAFASEIKALLTVPGIRARANPQRLYEYLRFGLTDHDGDTLFADIKQVPCAHFLEFPIAGAAGAQPRRYWELAAEAPADISFDEAARRLRELFLDSVRLHLRSDVAVGACLSGGIDSSSIVMTMRHLEGDRLDLHAVGYVADDEAVNEEAWIDLVGGAARARLHKVRIAPEELESGLERLIAAQDEPFGGTSMYAQYCVFRGAHEAGIKVMLDGQGADELLAGYRPYLTARLSSLLRGGRLVEAARFVRQASRLPGSGEARLLLRAASLMLPAPLKAAARRAKGADGMPDWLDARWFDDRDVVTRNHVAADAADDLRELLRQTVTRLSLPALLRSEDRNSMSFSVESRVPFLTPGLVDFILSLPEHYLIARDATTKSVFRAAMRGMVADAVLDRRDKIGFATPQGSWLAGLGPWVERVLESEAMARVPALRQGAVAAQWRTARQGGGRIGSPVWLWINLALWAEHFDVSFED